MQVLLEDNLLKTFKNMHFLDPVFFEVEIYLRKSSHVMNPFCFKEVHGKLFLNF